MLTATAALLSAVLLCGCEPVKIGPFTLDPTPVTSFFEGLFGGSSNSGSSEAAVVSLTPSIAPPAIAREQYLTVGITPTTLPFTYSDASGELSGLDVDVACALAEELGLYVRFAQVSGSADAVDQGVDVYIATTAAGAPEMVLCGTYEESASALFRSGLAGTATVTELTGSTIGVQSGSNSASVLSKMVVDCTAREYDSLNDAFSALASGSVDFVLSDAYMGAFIARSSENVEFAGTVTEAVPMGVAVASSNAELQVAVREAMEKLASNGRIELLRKRWVGDLPTLNDGMRVSGLTIASGATVEDVTFGSDAGAAGTSEGEAIEAGGNAVSLTDAG